MLDVRTLSRVASKKDCALEEFDELTRKPCSPLPKPTDKQSKSSPQ